MSDWSTEIEALSSQITRYYVKPDVAEPACAALRERLAGGAYTGLDGAAFADAVSDDLLAATGDQHLFLQYVPEGVPDDFDGESNVDDASLRAEQAMRTGHGIARVERLAGNVALLDLRHFYEPSVAGAGEAMMAAMTLVASADALIVDLRQNRGGEPDMVMLALSYLFDRRTQLTALYFPGEERTIQLWTSFVPGPRYGGTKPIWVLIGPRTASGAEGFAYDLQQYGRATLVGETTTGAGNFHYPRRVSGNFLSAVPSGYPVNPVSGTGWEGIGVKPDLAVPIEDAFDEAYRLALAAVTTAAERTP
jgi:C-terminal processing protease CtpA/Prc